MKRDVAYEGKTREDRKQPCKNESLGCKIDMSIKPQRPCVVTGEANCKSITL